MATTMTNTDSVIQQIKEHCNWYFSHAVQVITFHHRPSGQWYAVVYPAECTLSSAPGDQIHLHARATRNAHSAATVLLRLVQDRIGDCFDMCDGVPRGVVEAEAKCACVPRTALGVLAGQGSECAGVLRGVWSADSEPADQQTVDIPDVSCSLGVQTASAEEIAPVLQEVESTPETTKQQKHIPAAETSPVSGVPNSDLCETQPSTTAQPTPPPDEQILMAKPSKQPGAPEPATKPDDAPMSASPRGEDLIRGERMTLRDNHTRELIHEVIGRVLAAAMGTLNHHDVCTRAIVRCVLEAVVASLPRKE